MVVAGYNENACHCHDHKGYGVAASKDEEHDGKQNRKAHRCHRHKADGEQNDYKDGKADESCTPIDKPYACEEGQYRLSPLEAIPHGECVAEHTTKECGCCGKLSCSKGVVHYKSCDQHGKNGFANVDRHNTKGCRSEAVESLEVGKAGIFAAELSNIFFVYQAREDNGTVDATKQICHYGKGKAV